MANKIRMLPDNWTYADYFAFVKAFQTGNTAETFRLAQKIIVSWDYETDLSLKNAIMKLGVGESAEVIRTIMETIGNYLETMDISEIEVNFEKWDTERFMKFDEYRRVGNFKEAEPMMKEVVKWDKLPVDGEPMPFSPAAAVYKAITEAYKQIVSGKN